jgi:hypothetical protein
MKSFKLPRFGANLSLQLAPTGRQQVPAGPASLVMAPHTSPAQHVPVEPGAHELPNQPQPEAHGTVTQLYSLSQIVPALEKRPPSATVQKPAHGLALP